MPFKLVGLSCSKSLAFLKMGFDLRIIIIQCRIWNLPLSSQQPGSKGVLIENRPLPQGGTIVSPDSDPNCFWALEHLSNFFFISLSLGRHFMSSFEGVYLPARCLSSSSAKSSGQQCSTPELWATQLLELHPRPSKPKYPEQQVLTSS